MQFSTVIVGAFLSATAMAHPTSVLDTRAITWTMQNLSRTCATDNTSCTWNYKIKTAIQPLTPCTYKVTGSPATQGSINNVACGNFTVSQSFSDQFGADSGFTTLAITGPQGKTISFPSYSETQLANGKVVTPDLSFNVQAN